ncbi:MAG: glycosyltransferase [Cyanobacteria bacterium J06560_6]
MTKTESASRKRASVVRIMVYSHDAFGLGNLRRMLAICEHLLGSWCDLSILLVSGSPMIHEFRLPKGLDYIKLPCLNRGVSGQLSAKYLDTSIKDTIALRSQIIQSAATHFKPDLLLVDKKPSGLKGELTATLDYLQRSLPQSKCVLLLRDILDAPQKTVDEWIRWGYYQTLQTYYDQILVVGMQTVFDLVQEYRLPPTIARMVRYCGYIRKRAWDSDHTNLLAQLGLNYTDRLVLVTPGGGEDGYSLINSYLTELAALQRSDNAANNAANGNSERDAADAPVFHSVILCGPEMPLAQQVQLQQQMTHCPNVTFQSFTQNLFDYLKVADVVVSMSGYNTVTEVLSLQKQAVVVPRVRPSQEQLIRATRFARRGWVSMIHPEQESGRSLMQAILTKLASPQLAPVSDIDFNGLLQVTHCLGELISPARKSLFSSLIGVLV